MAYVKTNWAEDTPITAVALNNMETGIANALEKTGGEIRGNVLSIQAATPTGWSDFRVKRQIGDTTLEAILGASGTINDGLALMVQAGETKKTLNLSTNGGIWWDNNVIYHAGNKPRPVDIGFNWAWGSGNPTHLWGSEGNSTSYNVYDPLKITVGNSNKFAGKGLRVGSYTAGASGYITFGY